VPWKQAQSQVRRDSGRGYTPSTAQNATDNESLARNAAVVNFWRWTHLVDHAALQPRLLCITELDPEDWAVTAVVVTYARERFKRKPDTSIPGCLMSFTEEQRVDELLKLMGARGQLLLRQKTSQFYEPCGVFDNNSSLCGDTDPTNPYTYWNEENGDGQS